MSPDACPASALLLRVPVHVAIPVRFFERDFSLDQSGDGYGDPRLHGSQLGRHGCADAHHLRRLDDRDDVPRPDFRSDATEAAANHRRRDGGDVHDRHVLLSPAVGLRTVLDLYEHPKHDSIDSSLSNACSTAAKGERTAWRGLSKRLVHERRVRRPFQEHRRAKGTKTEEETLINFT